MLSVLTLQAVGVEQVLALLVALYSALCAPDALSRQAPQQALALVAVGRAGRRPKEEVVRGGAGDRVDKRLQGLAVHVQLLRKGTIDLFLESTFKNSRNVFSSIFGTQIKWKAPFFLVEQPTTPLLS